MAHAEALFSCSNASYDLQVTFLAALTAIWLHVGASCQLERLHGAEHSKRGAWPRTTLKPCQQQKVTAETSAKPYELPGSGAPQARSWTHWQADNLNTTEPCCSQTLPGTA